MGLSDHELEFRDTTQGATVVVTGLAQAQRVLKCAVTIMLDPGASYVTRVLSAS